MDLFNGFIGIVFQAKYGKKYENDLVERTHFNTFSDNLLAIREHNKRYADGYVSYYKGINQFTDMVSN